MAALGSGLGSGLVRQLEVLRAQSASLQARQEASRRKVAQKARLREQLVEIGSSERRLRASLRRRRERELRASRDDDDGNDALRLARGFGSAPSSTAKRGRKEVDDADTVTVGTVADLIRERKRQRRRSSNNIDGDDEDQDDEDEDDEDGQDALGSLRSSAALADEMSGEAHEAVTHRGLAELQLAYRLAGISMFRTQAVKAVDRMLGLRIDTSFQGRYYERYYLIFKTLKRAGTSELILQRHTLPHFIPAEDLFAEFDLAEFVRRVQAYANAYVTRREQTNAIVQAYGDDELHATSGGAFDVITFSGPALDGGGARIRVIYKTLLDTVPERVEVYGRKTARAQVASLAQPPMGLALAHVFKECVNILDSFHDQDDD
ncbi:Centromere protein O [Hondaea fermentalgiana]|uniref:Centromere protein O n=1 Tax=Hondaea fermentalgiana TaxID=2315210 RepID=A0A2R5GQC9_9STRA|nr:Centromere protein O [Hondaea fermentalgiana]|eukprot:GBG30833.1 Centromere protein O [Hondaea fermentalgiana]